MNAENPPFTVEILRDMRCLKRGRPLENVMWITRVDATHVTIRQRSYDSNLEVGAPLVCVGSAILGASKVLLLEAIGFLLRYLDPRMAELLYCDTDSVFLALAEPVLEHNVSSDLRAEFVEQMSYYVNSSTRLSGYLLLENQAPCIYIFGEKMYTLVGDQNNLIKPRMKGLSLKCCQDTFNLELVEQLCTPSTSLTVKTNTMKRLNTGTIGLQSEVKRFKQALNPKKRRFIGKQHSLPWC